MSTALGLIKVCSVLSCSKSYLSLLTKNFYPREGFSCEPWRAGRRALASRLVSHLFRLSVWVSMVACYLADMGEADMAAQAHAGEIQTAH